MAKFNGVDPQSWFADVLARIPGHKIKKLDHFMTRRYAAVSV